MAARRQHLDRSPPQMGAEEIDARAGKDPVRLAPQDQDRLPDAIERRRPQPGIVGGDEVLQERADRRCGEMAPEIALEQPRQPRRPRVEPGG